jgi:beta-galactosidase
LPASFSAVHPTLLLHHDDDAEVYINGVLAVKVTGYTTDYDLVTLPQEAAAVLRPGTNLLAVHCHQNSGGQFIDVGIVDIVPARAR